MGRTTYESLKRPLPDRKNIVLTRDDEFLYRIHPNGVSAASNMEEALEYAEPYSSKVFVIGGEQTYRYAMPFADKLEITRLDKDFEGDTFFPKIPIGQEVLMSLEKEDMDQNSGEMIKFRQEVHYLRSTRRPPADDVEIPLTLTFREVECVRHWRMDPDSIAPKFTKAEEADFRKKLERLGLDHEAILGLEYRG